MRDINTDPVVNRMRCLIRRRVQTMRLTTPVSIAALWQALDGRVVSMALRPSFHAALISVNPPIVAVNANASEFSQHFALAHELIHVWYHTETLTACAGYAYDANPRRAWFEVEANTGAAELLLPYEWFTVQARTILHAPLARPELSEFLHSQEARQWANAARVSLAVLGWHLQDLGWVIDNDNADATTQLPV